jgi:3-hydroxyisobutyrate dehydrogenase-like beta-hydroxyacid dehydrogenase
MKVGFIGLGRMGLGMAGNLINAGHEVTVYNRSPEKAAPLVAAGATLARSVAAACTGEAVMTMLADDAALEGVSFGPDGIVAQLAPGALHISLSTVGPPTTACLAAAHTQANQKFVAAPVFGRPEAAAAAKLFVVAAGAPDAITAATPLFEAIGQRTITMGEKPEAASLVKLSGNFLIAAVIETLGEAIALVGKAGVDPHQYVDLLTSTMFPAPAYKTYGGVIADGNYSAVGFAAPLGNKDIRLVLAAAEALRVPMPVASLLRDRFLTLLAQGGENLDWSAIGGLASKDSGQAPS